MGWHWVVSLSRHLTALAWVSFPANTAGLVPRTPSINAVNAVCSTWVVGDGHYMVRVDLGFEACLRMTVDVPTGFDALVSLFGV